MANQESGENTTSDDRPGLEPESDPSGTTSVRPMLVGLATFGLLVGVATGLSSAEGISKTLLSSLFTFTGGVLLGSFGRDRVSPQGFRRMGWGLAAFSLAVLVGLYAGIYARLDPPIPASLKEELAARRHETLGKTATASGAADGFTLQANERDYCQLVRSNLVRNLYTGEEGCKAAAEDLTWLSGLTCR